MESQDASSVFILKVWPWLEANMKRIVIATGIFALVFFAFAFFSNQQQQKQIHAGQALTDLSMSIPPTATPAQAADALLKFAAANPGTLAAKRAQLQGASALLAAGKYSDAQAQFQKYLDTYPGDAFASQAALGVAASLEAQGKTADAATLYQKLISSSSDDIAAVVAKFSLARIYEAQGKPNDARNLYTDILRSSPNSSLANDANMRLMELGLNSSTNTAKAAAPATTLLTK